jgi:hypothetical protein
VKILVNKSDNKFRPLTITITIETEVELAVLWSRTNERWSERLRKAEVDKDKAKVISSIHSDPNEAELWTILDDHWEQHLERKNEG